LSGVTLKLCNAWTAAHPVAVADEVLALYVSGRHGEVSGRARSGRVVEAAGTRTAQLLLEGEYGGWFRPDEHYIPLRKDFSNLDAALGKLEDRALTARLTEAAYEVAIAELTYERLIDRFHDALAAVL